MVLGCCCLKRLFSGCGTDSMDSWDLLCCQALRCHFCFAVLTRFLKRERGLHNSDLQGKGELPAWCCPAGRPRAPLMLPLS